MKKLDNYQKVFLNMYKIDDIDYFEVCKRLHDNEFIIDAIFVFGKANIFNALRSFVSRIRKYNNLNDAEDKNKIDYLLNNNFRLLDINLDNFTIVYGIFEDLYIKAKEKRSELEIKYLELITDLKIDLNLELNDEQINYEFIKTHCFNNICFKNDFENFFSSKKEITKEGLRQISKKWNIKVINKYSFSEKNEYEYNKNKLLLEINDYVQKGFIIYKRKYLINKNGQFLSIRKSTNEIINKTISVSVNSKNVSYYTVSLGSESRVFVHRLLAQLFLPNPNKYKYVSFIDGNTLNYQINNLKWIESPSDQRVELSIKNNDETLLNFIIKNLEEGTYFKDVGLDIYQKMKNQNALKNAHHTKDTIKAFIKKRSNKMIDAKFPLFKIEGTKEEAKVYLNKEMVKKYYK